MRPGPCVHGDVRARVRFHVERHRCFLHEVGRRRIDRGEIGTTARGRGARRLVQMVLHAGRLLRRSRRCSRTVGVAQRRVGQAEQITRVLRLRLAVDAVAAHLAEDRVALHGIAADVEHVAMVGGDDDQRIGGVRHLHRARDRIAELDRLVQGAVRVALVMRVVDAPALDEQEVTLVATPLQAG